MEMKTAKEAYWDLQHAYDEYKKAKDHYDKLCYKLDQIHISLLRVIRTESEYEQHVLDELACDAISNEMSDGYTKLSQAEKEVSMNIPVSEMWFAVSDGGYVYIGSDDDGFTYLPNDEELGYWLARN